MTVDRAALGDAPDSMLDPIEGASRREFLRGLSGTAFAVLFLAACGDEDPDSTSETVTVDDYFGPVTIPADAQRVISADDATLAAMLVLGVEPVASSTSSRRSR